MNTKLDIGFIVILMSFFLIFLYFYYYYLKPKYTTIRIVKQPEPEPESVTKLHGTSFGPIGPLVLILFLIIILPIQLYKLFLRIFQGQKKTPEEKSPPKEKSPPNEKYTQEAKAKFPRKGVIDIPTKLYEGDSKMIVIRIDSLNELMEQDLYFIKNNEELARIKINHTHLKVEIIAAGFNVAGELIQKCDINENPMIFQWNISPRDSGNHEIGLLFQVEDALGNNTKLGRITQPIKVVKYDHLTKQQLQFYLIIIGIFPVIMTIVELLKKFGLINF